MALGWWSISVTLTLSKQCYAYFHFIIKYEVIFGGNSSNISKIFTIQKQVVRIMAGAQHTTSCTSLFKQRVYLFEASTYFH
jgi:hypothetical protein